MFYIFTCCICTNVDTGLIVGAISAVIAISVILIVTVVLVLYFKR